MTHYDLIIGIVENFRPHDPIPGALVRITNATQAGGQTMRQGLTDTNGEVYFADIPELVVVYITITKEGYVTKRTTLIKQPYDQEAGFRLVRVTVSDGPISVISGMEDITGLLTWTNIAKAGAVVVLVGFGSKAFKEFKEAFKK